MNIGDLNNDMMPIDLLKVRGGNMEIQNGSPALLPVGAPSQLFQFEIQRPGQSADKMGNFEIQRPMYRV